MTSPPVLALALAAARHRLSTAKRHVTAAAHVLDDASGHCSKPDEVRAVARSLGLPCRVDARRGFALPGGLSRIDVSSLVHVDSLAGGA